MSDVPEVLEGDWEPAQIQALFEDLEHGAKVQHVQVRIGGDSGVQELSTTLQEAKGYSESGRAKAIQIRYEYDGQLWCDTLLFHGDAVKVIRTTLPSL
ncbi:MAG: hypothetical protein ACO1RT_11175 [Planctomycetaceae bacterium]